MKAADYLKKEIYIPLVDENDKDLGKVERWKAHKEGILHRAFTLEIYYQEAILLQHRKHIVFDGFFDATISSHQTWNEEENRFQTMEEAMAYALKRECGIITDHLNGSPELVKRILYTAKDEKSGLVEHEVDYIYKVELGELPPINYEYAYGYSLVPVEKYKKVMGSPIYKVLAPWVKEESFLKVF